MFLKLHALALLLGSGSVLAAEYSCIRAAPSPIFTGSAKLKAHSFDRKGQEAIEKVELEGGTRVVVQHSGCAHYVLTYQFAIREKHSVEDSAFWTLAATQQLKNIADAGDRHAAEMYTAFTHLAHYVYGDPIALSSSDSNAYMAVDASGESSTISVTYEIVL